MVFAIPGDSVLLFFWYILVYLMLYCQGIADENRRLYIAGESRRLCIADENQHPRAGLAVF